MSTKTLYERLGGYDAISAVANDLLPRLRTDPQLGRFWAHRAEDSIQREKQLLIDYLCACAGGSMYYRGRDMALAHHRGRDRQPERLGAGACGPGDRLARARAAQFWIVVTFG